jgi:hypothetical protein
MAEKCIRSLPSIRVSEPLEIELMRLAARSGRTLSAEMRRALELHVFGHDSSVGADEGNCTDIRALRETA